MSTKSQRSTESQPLLQEYSHLEDQTPTATVTPLPKAQLAALCIARLSDPISYTQIFPYINEFLTVLHVTDDPSKIGFYSGLVESVASIAQVITIFHWGKLSDVVGRRPIILAGALGLAAVSLLFGLCRTLLQVLVVRTITGLLTGNVAVYQAVLAEITDATNQANAYPVYGSIYGLGSTVGPLIGGFFSNVATKHPRYFGYSFLESYPYFLPGFVCAAIAMLGFLMTYCFLEETHPRKRPDVTNRHAAETTADPRTTSIRDLLAIPSVRTLAWSSFAMSFIGTGHSVVFVLFCYTPIEKGGLAFSVTEIGYTLAVSSAGFAAIQLLLMPTLLRTFDIARMYIVCMSVWPISFALLPFLNGIARLGLDTESDTDHSKFNLRVVLWIGIAVVQLFSRVGFMSFSTNLLLVRSNSPSPSALGAANGLNQFVMALARCASPAFFSTVFALSIDNDLLGGHLWVIIMTLISTWGYHTSRRVENPGRHK
ncbi:major facilitator superfamily domain-containing protein [Mycena vulgaris]|nr:major facilitator superfamily domain-containing protein [Mycena vulgaris]